MGSVNPQSIRPGATLTSLHLNRSTTPHVANYPHTCHGPSTSRSKNQSSLVLVLTSDIGPSALLFLCSRRANPVGTARAYVLDRNIMETSMRAGKLLGKTTGVTTVHGADSWTSLVATTYGLDALGRLRVVVRAPSVGLERGRLVVQVFSKTGAYARPLAAAQRAVTREDLARGIEISLHPQARLPVANEFHVLAWMEAGDPDLEYDGLRAIPKAPVSLGRVRAMRNRAELELRPVAAA